MSRIVVISSSLRANSNSEILADAFIKGAIESNNTVIKIPLLNKKIEPCHGCGYCERTNAHRCAFKDDMNEIIEEIKKSDIVIFSTPTYFSNFPGQLKTVMDKMTCIAHTSYIKKIGLLVASAGPVEVTYIMDELYKIFIDNFNDVEDLGVIKANNCFMPKSAKGTEGEKQAYLLGKGIK